MLDFALERVKKIVGKGEKAGHHHFLLSPQCFRGGVGLSVRSKLFDEGVSKLLFACRRYQW